MSHVETWIKARTKPKAKDPDPTGLKTAFRERYNQLLEKEKELEARIDAGEENLLPQFQAITRELGLLLQQIGDYSTEEAIEGFIVNPVN